MFLITYESRLLHNFSAKCFAFLPQLLSVGTEVLPVFFNLVGFYLVFVCLLACF